MITQTDLKDTSQILIHHQAQINKLCKKHNVTYTIELGDIIFEGATLAFEEELINLLKVGE